MGSIELKDKTGETINQEYYSQVLPNENSEGGVLCQREGQS
jgi:hypothetical protein